MTPQPDTRQEDIERWLEAERVLTEYLEGAKAPNSVLLMAREVIAAARREAETAVRAAQAEAALQRCCDESDYCYLCDNHPSHGHAKDCALFVGDKQ